MKKFWILLTLWCACFAFFQTTWQNQFVLDDLTKIQENADLPAPFSLNNFIYPYAASPMHFRNDPSRPLVFVMYWLCWHADDGHPLPFHLVNSALQATVAVLLAVLSATWLETVFALPAFTAGLGIALLFTTAPINVGTVIYAYGLNDLLSTVFVLAMLLLLWNARRPYWGLLFFALALSAKQSVVVALPILAAIDYFAGRRFSRARLLNIYVPLLGMTAAYLLWRLFYFGALGDLEGKDNMVSALEYGPAQSLMILKYLQLTFWPRGLSIDHLIAPWDFPMWQKILGWGALTLASLTLVRFAHTPLRRLWAVAWFIFIFSLLPTSSVLPTVDLFVERRAYLPNVGVFIGLGGTLWWFAHQYPRRVGALFVVLLVIQAVLAFSRFEIYADPTRLWQESLALAPQNPRALINLAVYESSQSQWDASRRHLEELLKIQPNNASLYSKLAYIYQQPSYAGHDDQKTWFYLEKSLAAGADNIFAQFNAGVYMMGHQRFAEAETFFNNATRLSPRMEKAWFAAGQAALGYGNQKAAVEDFRQVLQLAPNSEPAQRYLKDLSR